MVDCSSHGCAQMEVYLFKNPNIRTENSGWSSVFQQVAEKEAFEALRLEVCTYFDGILCPNIIRFFATLCHRHTRRILAFCLDLYRALGEIVQGGLDSGSDRYWIVKLEHSPFLHGFC